MNLVIGLGNILLTDEGIGIHVLRELKKRDRIHNAEFVDLGTSSLDLEYFINDSTEKIAVIDCFNSIKSKPGTVYRIPVDELKKKRNPDYSLHQLEFIDSFNLISMLSKAPETIILAVAPFDKASLSLDLSGTLKEQFREIYEKIENEIINFF
jgi:hydrogenase maturation protease